VSVGAELDLDRGAIGPSEAIHREPHRSNSNDQLAYPPVADLQVGVVSSDLGTPGSSVPGCLNSDLGDDALLNPIRNGLALRHHEP